MPTVFEAKKTRILRDLNVPAEQYQDASPKGTVDEGIRDLVDKINELDSLVTTSSCAGRMALYLEGSKSQEEGHGSSAASASVGGKGGGDWLFVSHDPIPEIDNDLESFCSPYAVGEIPLTITSDGQRLLHFKFEPMVGSSTFLFHVPGQASQTVLLSQTFLWQNRFLVLTHISTRSSTSSPTLSRTPSAYSPLPKKQASEKAASPASHETPLAQCRL